ncbi:MAG: hypothetical protein IT336_14860 [Thermomicrobiales bacterium]|nr:hypothetical protein [Thermomicrobiales bacterium]
MVDPRSLSPIEEPIKRLRRKRSTSDSSTALAGADPGATGLLLDAPGAIVSGVQEMGRGLSGLAGKIGIGGGESPAEPGNGGGFDAGSLASAAGNALAAVGDGLGKAASTAGDGIGLVANGAGTVLTSAGGALSNATEVAGSVLSGAGDVLSGAADVAGTVLSAVGDVAGPAAEATGEILGGLGEILGN